MENYRLNEIGKSGFFTKLSRTLYIGNLNENINDATLHKYFGEFGEIISINFKKGEYAGDRSPKIYAFVKYFDSNNVILAILKMNGANIEGCRVRLGFGKSYPSKCVWITGIGESENNYNFLLACLADCGVIINFSIDHINRRALVYYKEIENAEAAINKLKFGLINGLYLRGDYASLECQIKFAEFFNKPNDKKYVTIDLDNFDVQNTLISNVNKQQSGVSHYGEADNTYIASKEFTSEVTYIWVNGIADSVTNEYLEFHFSQFGPIHKCLIDRFNKCALLCYQEELHALSAVAGMNGSYIEGKPVYVRIASLRSRACDVSNINNYVTIQLKDNTAQSSPYSPRHVDPLRSRPFDVSNISNDNVTIQLKDNIAQSSPYSPRHVDPLRSRAFDVSNINNDNVTIQLKDNTAQSSPYSPRNVDPLRSRAFDVSNINNDNVTIQLKDNIAQSSPYSPRHVDPLRSRAFDVSNINNDNVTIQLKDNTAQSSPYSPRHVDPSCKCKINDETYPINISDPRKNSININCAQYTSQHKDLNTYNIDIPTSKTIHINNSSITIKFNEYPPERLKPLKQYANLGILSLPLPEFAKNISKELTSTSSRYSLSSNAFGNQDSYTFNVHHDEMLNYGLGKTDNQDKKQDQNNNHPPKSNYKMLESAAELQNLFFEEAKRFQDVLNKHTPKEFIQSQSSPKFKDQQLSSSLGTLSTSGSSKYSLCPSASVFQSQYNSPSDTQPEIIPLNSKTPLDSQILPSDPKLLIDPECSSAIDKTISNINGLFSTKKNNCTISNSMHTPDAINKDRVTPSNWLTNTPNYNCVEKLDHWCSSETSKKEKEGQTNELSKQKSLDGFVAKDSIEFVVQPNFVDVEKSTNIDEEKIDNDICEESIANILLSLKTNYQNKNHNENTNIKIHNETKDKIKKTNCNELAGGVSNNGNSENNKSVYYNHVNINEHKDNESQSISSTRSMGCKGHNIKSNIIQGEAEETNVNEYINNHFNIKNNKELKKSKLYFDHHEKKNKYCKPKANLDSKSIEPTFSKCSPFEFDMFTSNQTINKNKETKNKDCKFDKEPTIIEEEKQNLNILKSHENSRKDYKSKKYIKKDDGNITSSENSLKRSLSNLSEYHNDSKRWKTDNKTYKNDSTKTSEHHSPLSKPSKNIHNNWKPENKKTSKLNKTPNQRGIRGWTNGLSMREILSNIQKDSISNKVKTRSTSSMEK